MKTNNRLSKDNNTHEPKVRPMVEETLNEADFTWRWNGRSWKWNKEIVVERPMNDTEYIEHLEIKLQVLKELSLNDKESTSYFKIEGGGVVYTQRYVETQWKENQELKEHNINQRKAFAILLNEEEDKYKKEFRELNDKLLKVVESVVNTHQLEPYDFNTCECGFDCVLPFNCDKSKDILTCYKEHLLQEIKSAIQKDL